MKQISQTSSNRINALQAFIARMSDLLEPDGFFIPDPKDQTFYIKIPWTFFDEYTLNTLSMYIHMNVETQEAEKLRGISPEESPFIVGKGQISDELGNYREFYGYKLRTAEFAYMFGFDPNTMEKIDRIEPAEYSDVIRKSKRKEG